MQFHQYIFKRESHMTSTYTPLPESFFQKHTLQLAEALLGCFLVKETLDGTTVGIIVETEGYLGVVDRAAHSFGGRHTKRTAIMFEAPGHIYTHHAYSLSHKRCEW